MLLGLGYLAYKMISGGKEDKKEEKFMFF